VADPISPFCTFGRQHSAACADRVRRADHALLLCRQANEVISDLEKNQVNRFDQMDLLSPPADENLLAFWWSVQRACGVEYRRMARIFWTRCKHGKTSAGQGNGP